jgi:serine/threonine protein kinase/tetratricopeptide (TPR) repeat protein
MMTPELWERLKPLFNEAIEMPPQERRAFIDGVCGDDRQLKLELELLVIAHGQPSTTAESPIMTLDEFLPDATRFSSGELVLERFKIVRLLGSGGMGEVYEAIDLELGRIALKTIRYDIAANGQMMSRFKHEVQLARQVSDPHVCRIHELFVVPQYATRSATAFLTMEFLEGITLSEWLAQNGAVDYPEAESIALQLCDGLQAIHNAGVIHRDLKARNIMLIRGERGTRVVVMDFGLARFASEPESIGTTEMGQPSAIVGTPEYMAPEQFENGELSPATDVYALGVVLYELVTGRRPFAARTPVAAAVRRGKRPAPASSIQPTLPHKWDQVIDRCLEYDAEHRFQSASEVAENLRWNSVVHVTEFPAMLGPPRGITWRRKSIYLLCLIASIVLLTGILWRMALISHWTSHDPRERQVLLIGPFDNRTGDPVFDATLPEMFSAALQQSRYVAVFPPSRVADTLRAMGRDPSERIDEKMGLEICQRSGLQALLLGSINRLGSRYTLIVRAESPAADNILSMSKTVESVNGVPAAVDSVAADLRRVLGESKASLKDNALPLARVTSPSLDAIRYYTAGKQSLYNGDLHDSVQMLTKALELDPNFAMAHETLAVTYEQLTEFDREREEIHIAASLSGRVSETERLKILGLYYDINMDYERGCGYYKLLSEVQPTDPMPFINLGLCERNSFNYPSAVAATERAVSMLPTSRVRINLASDLFLNGDTEQALYLAEHLSREYPTDVYAQRVMGWIYATSGKLEEAEQTFRGMVKAGGDAETVGHAGLADLELSTGRYREAKEELSAAILSAEKTGNRFSEAQARITLAETLLVSGHKNEARKILQQNNMPESFGILSLLLGRAYAWNHQWSEAKRCLQRADERIVQTDVPPLRSMRLLLLAEIDLGQKNFSSAIDAAEKANAYYASPFAVETLARSYDAAGDKKEAATQYQILVERSNERSQSFDAPALRRIVYAHYRLGVLLQELGNYDPARLQLEKFLSYWSNADPDLELRKDAQRRLLVLRGKPPTPAT